MPTNSCVRSKRSWWCNGFTLCSMMFAFVVGLNKKSLGRIKQQAVAQILHPLILFGHYVPADGSINIVPSHKTLVSGRSMLAPVPGKLGPGGLRLFHPACWIGRGLANPDRRKVEGLPRSAKVVEGHLHTPPLAGPSPAQVFRSRAQSEHADGWFRQCSTM